MGGKDLWEKMSILADGTELILFAKTEMFKIIRVNSCRLYFNSGCLLHESANPARQVLPLQ
jgi:hypothetical protein